MTFIAGLRLIGIVAPMVLDGPINGRSFQTYVDRVLIPDLLPGDIVIMDNLGSHKGPGVQAAIEAAGATVRYLPPYSPDYNPIEIGLLQTQGTSTHSALIAPYRARCKANRYCIMPEATAAMARQRRSVDRVRSYSIPAHSMNQISTSMGILK